MKYTEEKLEKMIKSENWVDRAEVAKQGYGLERLIFDKDFDVRVIAFNKAFNKLKELVEQGKLK